MADVFKSVAKKAFLELCDSWMEFMAETFPSCENTKEARMYYKNCIRTSDNQVNESIKAWKKNVMSPLDPKKTKYAKPVERIVGKAIVYHAISYRDSDGPKHVISSEMMKRIDVFNKIDKMSEEQKEKCWKYIDEVTKQAMAYCGEEDSLPRVPTREEISASISKKKGGDESTPSLVRAFQSNLDSFCGLTGIKVSVKEEGVKQFMTEWNAFMSSPSSFVEGETHKSLCEKEDPRVFVAMRASLQQVEVPEVLPVIGKETWKVLSQMNGVTSVTEGVPTKMMGKIEDVAQKLAQDIVNGKTDISKIDLNEIGQKVLSSCDEKEMNQFVEGMGSLLPALGKMTGTAGPAQ